MSCVFHSIFINEIFFHSDTQSVLVVSFSLSSIHYHYYYLLFYDDQVTKKYLKIPVLLIRSTAITRSAEL